MITWLLAHLLLHFKIIIGFIWIHAALSLVVELHDSAVGALSLYWLYHLFLIDAWEVSKMVLVALVFVTGLSFLVVVQFAPIMFRLIFLLIDNSRSQRLPRHLGFISDRHNSFIFRFGIDTFLLSCFPILKMHEFVIIHLNDIIISFVALESLLLFI